MAKATMNGARSPLVMMAAAALCLMAAISTVQAYMPTAYIDIRRTHSNLEGAFRFFAVHLMPIVCLFVSLFVAQLI
jgi:hypothetical protein